MSDSLTDRKVGMQRGLAPMGKFLGEFGDVRAEALVAAIFIACIAGIVIVALYFQKKNKPPKLALNQANPAGVRGMFL
jgi:hypothetical protein